MSKFVILAIFPLLFVASAFAAYQTRKLARFLPSRAWTVKFRLMIGFMLIQIFGMIKTFIVVRNYNWLDPPYLICVLLFCIGLNYFDYLLIRDYRHLKERLKR